MRFPGLICSTKELAAAQNPVIIDCRFDLSNPEWGYASWLEDHIQGALYAHLDGDLSGPIVRGQSGRHPLPDREILSERLRKWGVTNDSLVVTYDQGPGACAARLLWLLRDLGDANVVVLDGGYNRWTNESRPITSSQPVPSTGSFHPTDALTRAVSAERILKDIQSDRTPRPNDPRLSLIDAREAVRFSGRADPIDPVAGYIPGARSYFFAENLGQDGCFDLEVIRKRFSSMRDEDLVCYCGSGVTATHNILAIRLAGLNEPALYAGSWSGWITDPTRPVETDPDN